MVEYSAENVQYGAASAGCGAYSGSNSLVFRFQRRWTQSVHEFRQRRAIRQCLSDAALFQLTLERKGHRSLDRRTGGLP